MSDLYNLDFKFKPFKLLDSSLKDKENVSGGVKRVRQGEFRDRICFNYLEKCAITNESIKEVLESAHIQGYINEKSHHPQNGILLRADFHKLFDVGLIHHERYLYDVMYPIKECDNFSIALETEQDCEITVKISIIKTELSCADFMTFILNKHVTEHEVYRYIESRPDKENNNFPWSADVYHFEVIYAFFKNTRDFSRECS